MKSAKEKIRKINTTIFTAESAAESDPDTKVTRQKATELAMQEHCVSSEHFTCEINTHALPYLITRGSLSKNK